VITKTKTKYPGITKITTVAGDIKYRLIIAVGKGPTANGSRNVTPSPT
jgi:hypothetical protein